MLGTLLGDAIGAPFEGVAAGDGAARLEYAQGQQQLRYTDDTQLTLALARHLVDAPQVDPPALRAAFADAYDPGRGYGAGMRLVVAAWRAGADPDAAARVAFDDGSFGNGAAMRVAPVGLRWCHDHDLLLRAATRSARVTHVHPIGIDGAIVQAAAVAHAATHGSFDPDVVGRLADLPATDEVAGALLDAARLAGRGGAEPAAAAEVLGAGVAAHRSVPLALWISATATDVGSALTAALSAGGDTDTIAAMALAVVGAAAGSVPAELLANVEQGPGGVDDVAAAAQALAAATASDGR